VKDPVLVLFWLWAAYLAGRLAVEAALQLLRVRGLLPAGVSRAAAAPSHVPGHPIERPARRRWTPLPAVLWLAGEAALRHGSWWAVLWLVLRDVSLNLVPGGVRAAPVRHTPSGPGRDPWAVAPRDQRSGRLAAHRSPATGRFEEGVGRGRPEEMGATIGAGTRPGCGPAARRWPRRSASSSPPRRWPGSRNQQAPLRRTLPAGDQWPAFYGRAGERPRRRLDLVAAALAHPWGSAAPRHRHALGGPGR